MKKLIITLSLICSYAAKAQIAQYVNINGNEQNFYKLGGYSYTEQIFPSGVQATPYVRMGPSPQNDFMYVATATGGIKNLNNAISTTNVGTGITLKMKNNNIRKFGANVITRTPDGTTITGEAMILRVYTNQGNGQSYIFSNSTITWMGLVATGENEYIDSVKVSYTSASTNVITIGNIMVGDDQAQNVSLNFDGVNDRVVIPNTVGNFSTNQSFTVSCWVKPASLQSDLTNTDVEILEKWDGAAGRYPFVIRYLNENFSNGSNVGKVVAARYDGFAAPSIMSSVSIRDGKWHHIAFVKDAGGLYLYIDGVLSASGTDNTSFQTDNTSALYVGSRSTINHFKGEIDEVRLWDIPKNLATIQAEMFCKNPNQTNLLAAYNFSEGVPNGNNALLTQVNSLVNNSTSAGILNNFAKIGDASNWVTGQVKYVKANAPGFNNGSSWANAFTDLQSALPANTCNDLFDVYVATGKYKPHASNKISSFDIPASMKIYGGFAGTEKNINQRDMALIHSTYETTLSGDLDNNDTPFVFDFYFNNNSYTVVRIKGGYVTFDGFTVSGGQIHGINKEAFGEVTISNCKIVSNVKGLYLNQVNSKISNCIVAGNNYEGIENNNNSTNYQNCLIVNNGGSGLSQISDINIQSNFTNCTIASNGNLGIENQAPDHFSRITNNIKNTIIKDNGSGGIANTGSGITTNNITYSLVQGETSTTNGNLNGNTVNPQFVSPLANNVISDAGNYRLKWCSLAIGAGNNTGISPLDLDRNPRLYRTNVDMGVYEHMGNTPTGANPIDITYTIDIPNYSGVGVQRITSAAKILAPAGTVNFTAPNSITLNPGFEARGVGKYFKAEIGANVGCVNP